MQHPNLSLAGKLDSGLTKGLCSILGVLKVSGLWLIGLMTLAGLPWIIFEYDEGLADLSLLEWLFIPLLALLIWRHIFYCQLFSTGFWRGLSRLLVCQGVMGALGLVIIGLLAAFLAQTENLQALIRFLQQDDPISKLVNFSSVLLAAYLAAPTSVPESPLTASALPERTEPSVSIPAKEASL